MRVQGRRGDSKVYSVAFELCFRKLGYLKNLGARMPLDMLIGATCRHIFLLQEAREMTSFGIKKAVSQVPEEFWLLYNHRKSYSILGCAHFWIFGLPFGFSGIGVSFGPDTKFCGMYVCHSDY